MAPDDTEPRRVLAWLRTPQAVRDRCYAVLRLAEQDRLAHFALDFARMDDVADYVAAVTRANYPDLAVPYHSRWRHFETGGVDRWGAMAPLLSDCDAAEQARVRIDLCTVSVLLDAGAGPDWSFHEAVTGQTLRRSEGLGIASLDAFRAGLFSGDPDRPLRVDANGLSRISEAVLANAFQVSAANKLVGLAGRAALLRNLGAALRRQPELFGTDARPGNMFDGWQSYAAHGGLSAGQVLTTVLEAFASIWPGRLTLGGENLGDVWPHPMLHGEGPAAGLVPFHKLSQWLCYSLVEALEQSSITVTGLRFADRPRRISQRRPVHRRRRAAAARSRVGCGAPRRGPPRHCRMAGADGGLARSSGADAASPAGVFRGPTAAGPGVARRHLGRWPADRTRTPRRRQPAACRDQ